MAALLIDETYLRTGSPKRAILEATSRMRGSYAFGILFADRPDTVYAIRRAAPLIVGLGEDENFIASDITAILSYTRRYIALGEDELAELTPERVHITDRDGVTVERTPQTALWEKSQAQKGGYPHFMKKEIAEEPQGVRSTLSPRVRDGLPDFTEEGLSLERLAGVRQLTVVACGTALHAGLLGADFARTLCRLPARCEIASEFRYADPILGPEDAVLLISQSGETADTLAALRLAKERGAYTVALINAVGSSIAREADTVLYTWAGPEIAVASTKAYTVQTSLLLLLMTRLGVARGTLTEEDARRITHQAMEDLPEAIAAILAREEEIATAAGQFARDAEHLFFIGRNVDYDCVTEASLKLKEISYIHSEAYAGGELKHGTISLIEEGTPVLALSTERALAEKLLGNVKEVASRGARVFAVVTAEDTLFERVSERVFRLPEMPDSIAPIAAATVFQLFAYHAAVMRGCPVDQPRNLAKSVTVE